jgi:hypothetical protein
MTRKVKIKRPVKAVARPKSAKNEGVDADTLPDGWKRFERAVDIAVKTKPMHRATEKIRKKKSDRTR